MATASTKPAAKTASKPAAKPASAKTKPVLAKTKPALAKTKPALAKTKPALAKTTPAQSVSSENIVDPVIHADEYVRQFAEAGLEQSRALFDSIRDAADSATVSFEDSTASGRAAAAKLNFAMLDVMKTGTGAMFEMAEAINEVNSPTDAWEIWGDLSRKQFSTMAQKGEDLSEAMRVYVEETAKPFTTAYARGFSA